MRVSFIGLVAALFLAGCAARLPVERPVASAVGAGTLTAFVPVSAERVTRASVGAGEREALAGLSWCEVEGEGESVEEEDVFRRHELGLFLGYTFERGEGGFSVGVDYTYKINEWLGVGPFFDYVAGKLDALAAGAGVWVRPIRCLREVAFYVAPGVDISQAREEKEEGEADGRSWETEFLLRFGAMVNIEVGRGYVVSPSVYWDWIGFEKSATVLGLTFGKEF